MALKRTPEKVDVPGCGLDEGEKHADRGALPGTVRAEEAEHIATVDGEVKVANGPTFAISLAQTEGLKNDIGRHAAIPAGWRGCLDSGRGFGYF